jgi:hypothetical protein
MACVVTMQPELYYGENYGIDLFMGGSLPDFDIRGIMTW